MQKKNVDLIEPIQIVKDTNITRTKAKEKV
jgi:hypothetical protein